MLILLFIALLLPLDALQLKNRLDSATPGDFIVYAHKTTATLLCIDAISEDKLVVTEIGFVTAGHDLRSWQKWLDAGAPGHISWTISTLDRKTYAVTERRSLTGPDEAAADLQFLPVLLQLDLKAIPKDEQKKIGPEPLASEIDHRKLWQPKIIFEAKELFPPVTAYRIIWPPDTSPLSSKMIDLYVADSKEVLTYLPYWIEVMSGPLKTKIYAIDSGRGLHPNSSY